MQPARKVDEIVRAANEEMLRALAENAARFHESLVATKKSAMRAAGSRDERYVSARTGQRLLAAAERDHQRRVRRLAREIAPRLAWKSRTEIKWITQAAINSLLDQADQIWGAKIAAMPTVASCRLTVVTSPDGQRRPRGRSG
jgi:hypothetical protein